MAHPGLLPRHTAQSCPEARRHLLPAQCRVTPWIWSGPDHSLDPHPQADINCQDAELAMRCQSKFCEAKTGEVC